jgi:NADH dehydrogenase FAD-containing subunit
MITKSASGEQIVLVGAGHAHLHVARHAARLRDLGATVVLVAPGPTGYSGMASGVLGGRYGSAENLIDPEGVAGAGGASFRRDRVTGLDRSRRCLQLDSGEELHYDRLSFNIGSVVDAPGAPSGGPRIRPAKPVGGLAGLRAALLEDLERPDAQAPAVTVVGGGATGCEIAANLTAVASAHGRSPAVTIVESEARLLTAAPAAASRALAERLERRGVRVLTGTGYAGVTAAGVQTDRGTIPAAFVVLATGLLAPPLVERLGIPADRAGGIHVDATLRSPADERIFAVGDCARFLPSPLPRIGVFGVRQAPVLLNNLAAAVSGEEPAEYRPQRTWLSILDLGDDTGLLLYGRLWFIGRSALWFKRRLDRRFVHEFAALSRPA